MELTAAFAFFLVRSDSLFNDDGASLEETESKWAESPLLLLSLRFVLEEM